MTRIAISEEVILGDFHKLSYSAQSLYLYLLCKADDYGLIDNTFTVICKAGYNADVLDALAQKGFVLLVGENTALIAHWYVHRGGEILPDDSRMELYTKITACQDGVFRWKGAAPAKSRRQNVFVPPTREEVIAYAREREEQMGSCPVDPNFFFDYFNSPNENGETWVNSLGKPVQSWKQTFCTWERSKRGWHEGSAGRAAKQSSAGHSGRVSKWNIKRAVDGRNES